MAKNRAILTSVIKYVESCGQSQITLRGHRDDSTSIDISQGKFKALVKFCIDSGDEVLKNTQRVKVIKQVIGDCGLA